MLKLTRRQFTALNFAMPGDKTFRGTIRLEQAGIIATNGHFLAQVSWPHNSEPDETFQARQVEASDFRELKRVVGVRGHASIEPKPELTAGAEPVRWETAGKTSGSLELRQAGKDFPKWRAVMPDRKSEQSHEIAMSVDVLSKAIAALKDWGAKFVRFNFDKNASTTGVLMTAKDSVTGEEIKIVQMPVKV